MSPNTAISCELLAPAGSFEMLRASIDAGADAAYLGLPEFNARRNADNFDAETFAAACEYAHLRGARLYVTMNTIIFDREMDRALEAASNAHNAGADAFIIQDLGLAMALRAHIPDVRLHASTQMSIHSHAGLLEAAELGFSRVTLAREMSLGEIASLCARAREIGIEIETFAHGAICISYSGQCLMSSMIGCRSANRGLCAQPCRMEYELIDLRSPDKPLSAPGPHLLSPKDLCALEDIPDLVDSGVASLKIEGRMKSAEYAHTVVSVYRKRLDDAIADEAGTSHIAHSSNLDSDRERLESVFSRGFTDAYLTGARGASMMSYTRPNNRGQFIGRVKSANDSSAEISVERPLSTGDKCEIWTRRGNIIVDVNSDCPADSIFSFRVSDAANRRAPSKDDRFLVYPSKGDRVFRIKSANAAFDSDEQDPKIPVEVDVRAHLGKPFQIAFSLINDGGEVSKRLLARLGSEGASATVEGQIVEAARTKAITKDEIIEHIARMGGTPFTLDCAHIDLDHGIGMGFSQIHKLRRLCLEELEDAILARLGYCDTPKAGSSALDHEAHSSSINHSARPSASAHAENDSHNAASDASKKAPSHSLAIAPAEAKLCVLVSNPECARAAKRSGADVIYVSALNYRRGMAQMQGTSTPDPSQAGYPKHCVLDMGAISHDALGASREAILEASAWDAVKEGSRVVAGSIDGLRRTQDLSCEIEIGPTLPAVNHRAIELFCALGASCIWLSSELALTQIEHLAQKALNIDDVRLGVVIAGAQELMTSEHCMLQSLGGCSGKCATCSRRKVPFALKDRMGYTFPVALDCLGRSHIYNSLETDNASSIPALLDAGVGSFMLNAQLMDVERTAQETARIRQAIEYAASNREIPRRKNATTAHMFRPVS